MDKLIHGPTSAPTKNPPDIAKSNFAISEFHPLDEASIFADFKALLTRPRYFFEFFTHRDRINHVVWAKVVLIFLALSALNSMTSFSHSAPWTSSWNIEGLNPQMQSALAEVFSVIGNLFSQVFAAAVPFLTLVTTALTAAGSLIALRLMGGKSDSLSWSGIFCVLITAQWTTIFGFVPGVGIVLAALIPFVFSVIGLAQVSRLSKLRTFVAAFILPGLFAAIAMSLIAVAMVSLVSLVWH